MGFIKLLQRPVEIPLISLVFCNTGGQIKDWHVYGWQARKGLITIVLWVWRQPTAGDLNPLSVLAIHLFLRRFIHPSQLFVIGYASRLTNG
jgi:hypothetical protein